VRLQNIGDGFFVDERAHISVDHYTSLAKQAVEAGDGVVASLGAELPRACVVPEWLGPAIVKADCIRLRAESNLATSEYLAHALNAPTTRRRVESLVHGVGRPRIGLTLLRQLALPLPPVHEQRRITEEVDRLFTIAGELSATTAASELRCTRLRQSILKWAFEGRLVDQDPTDEPASVLLERIRAERRAVAASKPKRKTRRKKSKK
jgi:type I restriction enzyme S subunit